MFSPAPFTPPGQLARPGTQDVFGKFMETLGMRAPARSRLPRRSRSMLRAQPMSMQGMMGAPRKAPLPKVHPELARRFPGSARMAELLDGARRRKGTHLMKMSFAMYWWLYMQERERLIELQRRAALDSLRPENV